MLSAEQNESQSEEINVIDESQAVNRSVFVCLAAAQEITHAVHSLSRLGELHVKAGYVSTRLAGAPSFHVNRP